MTPKINIAIATIAAVLFGQPGFAEEFPKPSAELCQKYRQGPVIHKKIPIYFGKISADPASFYWADIWYDPQYLSEPALDSIGRPDGLPNSNLLFDLEISTGKPLPLDYRRSVKPSVNNFFTMLQSGGRSALPASRVIPIDANAKMSATWHRTGKIFHGFERVEVSDRLHSALVIETKVYIMAAPNHDVAVLTCDVKDISACAALQYYRKIRIFRNKLCRNSPQSIG